MFVFSFLPLGGRVDAMKGYSEHPLSIIYTLYVVPFGKEINV